MVRRFSVSPRFGLLLALSGLAAIAMAPTARAHGDEAAFHNVEGVSAPTLEVMVRADGPAISLHLDTKNFTWASGTAVANFKEGEGGARIYFDTNRAARILSPDVTFDARAWNLAPGEHTVTVVLTGSDLVAYAADGEGVEVTGPPTVGDGITTDGPPARHWRRPGGRRVAVVLAGSDLVSYAADGEEVEVTVPFTVGEVITTESLPVPGGSSFDVTGARDPFGGWIFTSVLNGFGSTGAQLEYALDGKPWTRTQGGSIHVYPDAIIGKEWQDRQPLPSITVTAMNSEGAVFNDSGTPVTLSFTAPVATEFNTWSWPGEAKPWPWRILVILVTSALVLVVAAGVTRRLIRSMSQPT